MDVVACRPTLNFG